MVYRYPAMPDPASEDRHCPLIALVLSVASPSSRTTGTVGGAASIRYSTLFGVSALPGSGLLLSKDQYVTLWVPSLEMVNGVLYACSGPPSMVYRVSRTPDGGPLVSGSILFSVTVTGLTQDPLAGGEAVVTGGVRSRTYPTGTLVEVCPACQSRPP